MRSEFYQVILIFLGVVATAFFGVFLWREVYPEYRIYQNDYIALENFRSSYTGDPPPAFSTGVKQIVIEREDKGPPHIDRCTSCHVALDIPYFSQTKVQHDINGNVVLDAEGIPVKVPNEDYIWAKLDEKIKELTDPKVNENLASQGESRKVKERLKEAENLKALKTAEVSGQTYDVSKALTMHPLLGRETRPFEYHPMQEYGCTWCHNGNGRGLTTDKAHGPVFDGQYEIEYMGPVPNFTETDLKNDPKFAREFNYKPGSDLVFQTTPIFVGSLIQAKCMQCHQTSSSAFLNAVDKATDIAQNHEKRVGTLQASWEDSLQDLITLISIKSDIQVQGLEKVLNDLEKQAQDYSLSPDDREKISSEIKFLQHAAGITPITPIENVPKAQSKVLEKIDNRIEMLIGSPALIKEFERAFKEKEKDQSSEAFVSKFVKDHQEDPQATGMIFEKAAAINYEKDLLKHIRETQTSFERTVSDQKVISSIQSDVDLLTKDYQRGQELYITQACYACHRIAGFARGGVGPELTQEGRGYPWFIKQSIVWPQADVKSSTMPNYRLDHADLEPLMTFLLGQVGENKVLSGTAYKTKIQEWEAGRKQPFEKAISPEKIHDLRYAMTLFATQGCAACHRLKGFESDVGYRVEREQNGKADFETLYKEREWFTNLFPEMIEGSQIVAVVDKYANEIDQHIVDHVREGSILEEIDKLIPDNIESFYTDFKFASRAKNYDYTQLAAEEKDPSKKDKYLEELNQWKERIHRILMVFVQEYGLGRLIGPRPNWSGVYHTDQWLMEHFHKPTEHLARSIMPVFPFDDTKFYALTYMLDVLGKRNRDWVHAIWTNRGFNAETAFQIHCSQCHGETREGNGPVSEWIYPIPKNLRNADFLRNMTKERLIDSIKHGVKGTPMPPWGEAPEKPLTGHIPVLSEEEIKRIVDWLFSSLPGGTVIKSSNEVQKWQYTPEDVLKELHEEGSKLNYVFDRVKNPPGKPDDYSYYIKEKYYTEHNISQGKAFFEINCAICHGAEADGTGLRAEIMQEAKPRMLTDLDWLKMHDDLYLLRSIKYGVPGTAMTPWGDLTNSLQRLQLVMFIRSLSQDEMRRLDLGEVLYKAFDQALMIVEESRIKENTIVSQLNDELNQLRNQQLTLQEHIQEGKASSTEALEIYKKELEIREKRQKFQKVDQLLVNLKNKIVEEQKNYETFGNSLIPFGYLDEIFQKYLTLLNLTAGRFNLHDGTLILQKNENHQKEIYQIGQEIENALTQEIDKIKAQQVIVSGKIFSEARNAELEKLSTDLNNLTKAKDDLISTLHEGTRIQKEQEKVFKEYEFETQKK